MFKKTILTEFFTTISLKQAFYSLYLMTFRLPFLRYWKDIQEAEKELLKYISKTEDSLKDRKILSFYNWRSAIYQCLKMIWIISGDEVIVSGYNCVSVSNAVLQSWARVVYCDIEEETLWLDVKDLESKITKNTKAVIVQHTFWKISNVEEIKKIVSSKDILIIEDCAHSLWTKNVASFSWEGERIQDRGQIKKEKNQNKDLKSDFSIYSTWRDKVISSVTWWFLVVNNSKYFDLVKDVRDSLKMPSILLVIKNLLYNVVAYKAYKLYDFFKIWRIIIHYSRKLNIITEILTKSEKECNFSEFNYRLPNSLAYLVRKELKNLEKYNTHRRKIAKIYDEKLKNIKWVSVLLKEKKWEKLNYFRYPIICNTQEKKEKIVSFMKKNHILLWVTWSWKNIAPIWTDLEKAKYKLWICKTSEEIADRIVFLPNHKLIGERGVEKVIWLLNF